MTSFIFPWQAVSIFLITARSLEAANIHYLTAKTLIAVIKNRRLFARMGIYFSRFNKSSRGCLKIMLFTPLQSCLIWRQSQIYMGWQHNVDITTSRSSFHVNERGCSSFCRRHLFLLAGLQSWFLRISSPRFISQQSINYSLRVTQKLSHELGCKKVRC